ncbi:hypothetical protein Dimus_013844 [Dionaea muscipula]
MSGGSVRRRLKSNGADDDDDDDNEEEEDEEDNSDGIIVTERKEDEDKYSKKDERKKKKKRIKAFVVSGYKKGVRNAKRVVLILPFRKFQKLFFVRKNRRSSPTCSINHSNSNLRGSGGGGRFGSCNFCLCLSRPQTIGDDEDAVVPKKHDPNDPETSLEALRVLVEKNHFFDKECSTHFSD